MGGDPLVSSSDPVHAFSRLSEHRRDKVPLEEPAGGVLQFGEEEMKIKGMDLDFIGVLFWLDPCMLNIKTQTHAHVLAEL